VFGVGQATKVAGQFGSRPVQLHSGRIPSIDPFETQRPSGRWLLRLIVACLIAGWAALGLFALVTQHHVVVEARKADATNGIAGVYQDARFWVGQDESLERKYRVEPSLQALALHKQSGERLIADVRTIAKLEGTPAAGNWAARLLVRHREYEAATARMFAATRAGNVGLVERLDHTVTDPIFTAIEREVFGGASRTARKATAQNAELRKDESSAFNAGLIAIVLAVGLAAVMRFVIGRYRRAQSAMRAAELKRLSLMTVTDSLTSLGNHRGFYEDLERELALVTDSGAPLALVLLDVDGLREINNTYGHQAGDDQLRSLARTVSSMLGARERAYRIGDDEFAVLLPGSTALAGFQFTQRLESALRAGEKHVRATAGIAQAAEPRPRDALIGDADRALISAKRSGQAAVLFTPDMDLFTESTLEKDDDHNRTLANSLALAVDAKDSYTQSHSQTVANLCAAIAEELGLDAQRLQRIRIAGLLHDVGKIGIPDAVLRKPAKLTGPEYELMKTHAALGADIVLAAEMPQRAEWIRHHHERIDGRGYPDGLAGEEIPLESRIIHVADAFEAMTSDRPYRKAQGERFAIEELRRNAGTQFDGAVVDAFLRVLGHRPTRGVVEPRSRSLEPAAA
jgi:diguanylate cyclase (GGDEF)-like protein/putative nucleotidyltransferase with HDIG domain